MKKLLTFLAFLFALPMFGYTDGYYNSMDGKKKESLKAAAKECVTAHTRLNYTELPTYWQYSDVYPELVDGSRRWWDMYSNNIYLIYSNEAALTSFRRNSMQREHAVPKSWWKKDGDVEYTPAYSDMWNLYPSDGPANQAKLNYAFGECRTTSFDNGLTKVGAPKSGMGGGSGSVFEPGDEYKGDFARAIFYMATVYDDLPWVVNYMFSANDPWPTLRPWAVDMLLDWARRDPVSQKEKDRNNSVEKSQGNRNPFIDFPELAEYIWGTRMDQTFLISEQGGNVTPPITGDPEVISPVNDEALDFGQAAIGQTVSAQLIVRASNLTSNLSVRVTGTDRAMFTPSTNSIPALDLNLGDTYIVTVVYRPTSEGQHTAALTLYDGGLPLGSQINVTLIGQAFPIPKLTALTALPPTNMTTDSYQANWEAAPQVIDYYVVNRVRYVGDNMESETLESDVTNLVINDFDPEVLETYTVQSSRLGYLSPLSNSIIVSPSSVKGVYEDSPWAAGHLEGGFTLIFDGTRTGLKVYDTGGRLVMERAVHEGGESYTLPNGIYFVTDDQTTRPLKIAVY